MKSNHQTKLKLDTFYKSEEKQYVFLRRLALTFRAQTPLLSDLFQVDEKELYDKLLEYNKKSEQALLYLFNFDLPDQDEARIKLMAFYDELLNAVLQKDVEAQRRLIGLVADSHVVAIIKKSRNGEVLDSDELYEILCYQIKHAMSQNEIASLLGMPNSTYESRTNVILNAHPELQDRYNRMCDFNISKFWVSKGDKYGK